MTKAKPTQFFNSIFFITTSMETCEKHKCWYVLYTYPQSERKADTKLRQMGITSYLPLHKVIKQWSDRKKVLEVPLFPNYIFVNSSPHQRFNALKIKELVKFVTFEGKPAVVSEDIISSLKNIVNGEVEVSNESCYDEGMKVKIKRGKFEGTEGILIRKNAKTRLLVRIDALQTHVSVDISLNDVEVFPTCAALI